MISYDESLKILNEMSVRHPHHRSEGVSLSQAVGRILAGDIVAIEDNPPFDNSAMDGFAVNTASVGSEIDLTKKWIPVQTLISAGDTDVNADKGKGAVEIMTGAMVPDPYFDAVVRVEDVDQSRDEFGNKMIRLKSNPVVGENIRRAGEDTRIGDTLLSKGMRISNEHLLALATQGFSRLEVKRKIKVAILSTGKEIVPFETKDLRLGQIRNSTGPYLEASLLDPSLEVKSRGIIQDDPDLYIQELKNIFSDDCDILISTGAVSVGVHDFVRPALESIGAKIHFHKCAIRPGKPILFGSVCFGNRTRFIFGVPGNPVSTAVGLRFFIKPFIDLLLTGRREKPMRAVLISDTKKPEGLKCFFKAKMNLDGPEARVESLKGQSSFMVSPLIQSNAWVVFPETGSYVKRGTEVEVFNL
ncbi:MAG TPA: molybdopterin molybdotransferase MoeA [Bdellovibrionales bacterium]|nr:molybdopterin molybdotransferase MoeA [Bdellovibrionales bacterium]